MVVPKCRRLCRRGALAALGAAAVILGSSTSNAQALTPELIAGLRNVVGSRIAGAVLLAGDQTISGGNLSQASVGTVGGASETWKNYLEVDQPLEVEVFGCELHVGGTVSRTEIYGDVRTAFNADHIYQTHPRVVLDVVDKLWKLKWLGVGGTYLWGSGFSAWSVGVDVALSV